MNAERSERRPVKIRRRGRHKTPSQIEKVATQAGKAAPAVAIAGALVAAPHAHAHAARAVKPVTSSAAASHHAARVRLDALTAKNASGAAGHQASGATLTHSIDYTVKSGDTLSQIAQRYYHRAADWQWLYHENDTRISDPNLIYPGQTLLVPADPPANYTLPSYVPRHAKTAVSTAAATTSGDSDDSGPGSASASSAGGSGASASSGAAQSASQSASSTATATTASSGSGSSAAAGSGSGSTTLSGTLGCTGLEELWTQAGGNPADAFMAAEIAMAESGGNQYALSPTDDYGYWQINASNGSLATFNAYGNARSAIILSDDGTNWSPWTTYTSGAYVGRC
jgi:LysM repeat protein